jgi:hypothetical protein
MTIQPAHGRVGFLGTAAIVVVLAGCGDAALPVENPNAEACEHVEIGPAVGVTAAAMSSPSAPKIDSDHKRYDVTTVPVSGGKGGYVTFAPIDAGDYNFYTTQAVTLNVKSAAGAEVPVDRSDASIPECTEVKGRHVFALQVGTYIVGISGAVDKVGIVVEPGD